jgi:hypothetical protein
VAAHQRLGATALIRPRRTHCSDASPTALPRCEPAPIAPALPRAPRPAA